MMLALQQKQTKVKSKEHCKPTPLTTKDRKQTVVKKRDSTVSCRNSALSSVYKGI